VAAPLVEAAVAEVPEVVAFVDFNKDASNQLKEQLILLLLGL
jgi:hypothetical protein